MQELQAQKIGSFSGAFLLVVQLSFAATAWATSIVAFQGSAPLFAVAGETLIAVIATASVGWQGYSVIRRKTSLAEIASLRNVGFWVTFAAIALWIVVFAIHSLANGT